MHNRVCQDDRRKVLHIITRLDCGGSAWTTILTVLGHDRRRLRVGLVYGRIEPLTAEEAGVMANAMEQLRQADVGVFQVPSLVREITPLSDVRALLALWRLFRRERPALIHTHTSKAGVLGRFAAWLACVPAIVHTPHGHTFYGYYGKAGSWLICVIERFLAQMTDRIVTLTDRGMQEHIRFRIGRREKFTTIPSGIALSEVQSVRVDPAVKRKELGLPANGVIIGTVGRLVAVKGHASIIRAAPHVVAEFPNARFVFVGDGPLQGELRRLGEELGVGRHLIFLGSRLDVPECLATFNLFCFPSLNEGMGRALIEAMALGLPVVATRVGGIPDIVADGMTGLLVPPRDDRALAVAILTLLRDRRLSASYGQAARRHVDGRFDVETMVRNIERLYDEVWQEKHPAT